MSRNRRFVSLNLKMAAVIVVGLGLALGMYLVCTWFTDYITQTQYLSDEAIEHNVGEVYDSLEEYIEEKQVKAEDTKALSAWLKEQEYTYFFVYDNYGNVFEAGWWVNSEDTDEDLLEDEESVMNSISDVDEGQRIDEENFTPDARNRIVEFADGKYYVYIDVYREIKWQSTMKYVTIVLSFLTLLGTLMWYHSRMLKRIIFLSTQVQQVSDGKLDYKIYAMKNDEIGSLAVSVDNMRTSIIQKHQSEREAWEANTQLITAMSHDIRTPLTSMIGYLDIIEGKKYETQEQLERYISSCREKAFQLKDLSDKLFQYFLVFGGNQESDKPLERFDANILFQQLLSEHCAEMISYGYRVDFTYLIPDVNVLTDLSGLRRLFDNLFSNMMKYADKSVPISIKAELVEDRISMDFANGIPTQAKKVESTRIGLKTCEKICSDLQGNFRYQEEAESFRTHIDFPAIPAEPEISAEAETPTEPEPEPAPASKPDLEPEPDPETVRASAPVTEEQPAAELQSAVYGQLETSGQPGASAQSETRE